MTLKFDIIEEESKTIIVNQDFIEKIRKAAERQKASNSMIKDVDRLLTLCKTSTRFEIDEFKQIMKLADDFEVSDDFEITEE